MNAHIVRTNSVTAESLAPTLIAVDQKDFAALQLGFVWAEELYQSTLRSEVLSRPVSPWPGSMAQARMLARSTADAQDGEPEKERLARIVQRGAAAFWDMLCSSSGSSAPSEPGLPAQPEPGEGDG